MPRTLWSTVCCVFHPAISKTMGDTTFLLFGYFIDVLMLSLHGSATAVISFSTLIQLSHPSHPPADEASNTDASTLVEGQQMGRVGGDDGTNFRGPKPQPIDETLSPHSLTWISQNAIPCSAQGLVIFCHRLSMEQSTYQKWTER